MGVSIDDLVRVELHLEETAVSLVSMGEQTDYIVDFTPWMDNPRLNAVTEY
jgi:hypothetical protein